MAGKAEITIEVDYDDKDGNASKLPPTKDKVTEAVGSSLSGKGDSTGGSTDATEPDGAGGSEQRERSNAIPKGGKLVKASATIKMDCGKARGISLKGSGNVSVSASVVSGGDCIQVVEVNTAKLPNGGTEKKTTTKKKCCPGVKKELSLRLDDTADEEVAVALASAVGSVNLDKLAMFIARRSTDLG